jgi:glycosyltransferase involved in cell wall biosynthesis
MKVIILVDRFGRFRFCDGVAHRIQELLKRAEAAKPKRKRLSVLNLPPLGDLNEFQDVLRQHEQFPYLAWAGPVDGYLDSVLSLVRCYASACRNRPKAQLLSIGGYSPASKERILAGARSVGLSPDRIVMPGFVPRLTLLALYAGARALLAPLEDDERSGTRFRSKITEYVAAGRPVITNSVSDVLRYFTDGDNALIAPPGDIEGVARRMALAVDNPEAADRIGAAGLRTGWQLFHHASHGLRLKEFFQSLWTPAPQE